MNKNQWFALGFGLIILASYLFKLASSFGICGFEDISDLICNNRRYAYGIPAIILMSFGWICSILGFLEKKK